MKIAQELIEYVLEEAQRRYDREIPGWVEFKLLGADIIRWARLEILKRGAERCRSSAALPASPAIVAPDPEMQDQQQHGALPPSDDSSGSQDSDQLPSWLEQTQ